MKQYESIAAVVAAVRSGELDESQLTVVMDNDCSRVEYGPWEDDHGEEIDNVIFRGKGYYDVEDLWPLVFPQADVEWC